MIALVSQPPSFSAQDTPTTFMLHVTSDGRQTYGRKGASATIVFNNTSFETGDNLLIVWADEDGNEYQVEMNAVDTVTTFNELPTSDNLSEVVMALNNHPSLQPYFLASLYQNEVTLMARSLDANWVVEFQYGGKNKLISVSAAPTISDDTPTGHEVEIEIYIEGIKGFKPPIKIKPSADSSGMVKLELELLLKEELKRLTILPPPKNLNYPYTIPVTTRFYLRYRENFYKSTSKSWNISNYYTISRTNFSASSIVKSNSIISKMPNRQTISANQPHFLSWYNYTGAEKSPFLQVSVTYINGLTSVYEKYKDRVIAKPNALVVFPVGTAPLELSSDVRKYSVEVKLENESSFRETASASRSYFIDMDCPCHRTLIYNDFNFAPQTVEFKGRTQMSLEVTRYDSIRIVGAGEDRELFQWDYDFRNVFRYRSGYITKALAFILQEMLILNNAYEVRETENVPIHILSKKFDVTECLRYLNVIEFDATLAFLDKLAEPTDGGTDGIVERYYWNTPDGGDWENNFFRGWEHEGQQATDI